MFDFAGLLEKLQGGPAGNVATPNSTEQRNCAPVIIDRNPSARQPEVVANTRLGLAAAIGAMQYAQQCLHDAFGKLETKQSVDDAAFMLFSELVVDLNQQIEDATHLFDNAETISPFSLARSSQKTPVSPGFFLACQCLPTNLSHIAAIA